MRTVCCSPCSVLRLEPALASRPKRPGGRNLDVLKRYGELGRQGDHAQQAAMWAPERAEQRPRGDDR